MSHLLRKLKGPLTFALLSGSAAYTTRVAIRNVVPDRIRANRQAQAQQLSVQASLSTQVSPSTQASASLQALRDYQRALEKFQDAEKDGKKASPELCSQLDEAAQASPSTQAHHAYRNALARIQDAEKAGKKASPELHRKLDEATQRIDDIIAKIEAKIEAKDRKIERLRVQIAALKVREWKREWMKRMGGLIRWNAGVVSLGHVEKLVSVFR